jgi:hypothetical protein
VGVIQRRNPQDWGLTVHGDTVCKNGRKLLRSTHHSVSALALYSKFLNSDHERGNEREAFASYTATHLRHGENNRKLIDRYLPKLKEPFRRLKALNGGDVPIIEYEPRGNLSVTLDGQSHSIESDEIDAIDNYLLHNFHPEPIMGNVEAQEEASIDDAPDDENVEAHDESYSSLDEDEASSIDAAADGDEVEATGDESSEDAEARDDSALLNNAQVSQSDPGLSAQQETVSLTSLIRQNDQTVDSGDEEPSSDSDTAVHGIASLSINEVSPTKNTPAASQNATKSPRLSLRIAAQKLAQSR